MEYIIGAVIGLAVGLLIAHTAVQYQRILIEETSRERDKAREVVREVAEEFAAMRPELEALKGQTAEVMRLAGELARVPLGERVGK
jgi:gas vesicle protein